MGSVAVTLPEAVSVTTSNLFSQALKSALLTGQVFALFVITVAAAEVGIGLAIVILIYRNRETVNVDEINLLKW